MDQTEPVRLVNWIVAVLTAAVAGLSTYSQTSNWVAAVTAALAAIVGLVGAAEVARTKVVSPDTLQRETGRTIENVSR